MQPMERQHECGRDGARRGRQGDRRAGRALFHRHFNNEWLAQATTRPPSRLRPAGWSEHRRACHLRRCLSRRRYRLAFCAWNHQRRWRWQGRARYNLSAAFVLEEGFPLSDLERIVAACARFPRRRRAHSSPAHQVVEKGKGGRRFHYHTGIGVVPPACTSPATARPRRCDPGQRARLATTASLCCPSARTSPSKPKSCRIARALQWPRRGYELPRPRHPLPARSDARRLASTLTR